MLIRAKVIANELRNDIRYSLFELFAHCTKARNQPTDIRDDCIIGSGKTIEIAMKQIFSLIEFKPIKFPATSRAGLKRNREIPKSLGDILRAVDSEIPKKLETKIEANMTPRNLRVYLEKIKSAGEDGFVSNMKNFFFPSSREFDERDLYTLAYMRILEEAFVFDAIEDAIREYPQIEERDGFVPYETVSDGVRLGYCYLRQMPVLAILLVSFFILYIGYVIFTTSGTLNLSSIMDAILLRTPYYFTAKTLAQSVTNPGEKAAPPAANPANANPANMNPAMPKK